MLAQTNDSPIGRLTRLLGGAGSKQSQIGDDFALIASVRNGLPTGSVKIVADAGRMSSEEIERIIPRRTLAHRRARKERLSLEESNRLVRVARTIALAYEVLGEIESARTWLRRPNRALDGQTPMTMLDTDVGARVVETVLGRIAHGVFS